MEQENQTQPYLKQITRLDPGFYMILVNLSDTMPNNQFRGSKGKLKSYLGSCCEAISYTIEELVIASTRDSQHFSYYFDFGVFGYQLQKNGDVFVDDLLPILELGGSPEPMNNFGEKIFEHDKYDRKWLKAIRKYKARANPDLPLTIVKKWTTQHPHSFPPIIVHITNNNQIGKNVVEFLRLFKATSTDDGHSLLLNIVLTPSKDEIYLFPKPDGPTPENIAIKVLLQESSILPARWITSMMGDLPRPLKKSPPEIKGFMSSTNVESLKSNLKYILDQVKLIKGTIQVSDITLYQKRNNIEDERLWQEQKRAKKKEQREKTAHKLSIIATILAVLSIIVSVIQLVIGKK